MTEHLHWEDMGKSPPPPHTHTHTKEIFETRCSEIDSGRFWVTSLLLLIRIHLRALSLLNCSLLKGEKQCEKLVSQAKCLVKGLACEKT